MRLQLILSHGSRKSQEGGRASSMRLRHPQKEGNSCSAEGATETKRVQGQIAGLEMFSSLAHR